MDDISIALMIVMMLVALVISIVPFVPGPVLLWLMGTVYGIANGFDRITVIAVLLMTLFMLIGSTQDLWLRAFGMRTQGASCWSVLGSLIGGIIGTGLIPIPIVGTAIGIMVGALLVEFMRLGELADAFKAGRVAVTTFMVGFIVELSMSIAIFITFIVSVWSTA
jgi:uncharacterized protein YqgC (DUF456 family)